MTEGTELDEIMAEAQTEPTPETETTTEQQTETASEDAGQSRDDKGRFAPKAETPPEQQEEQPQEPTTEPDEGKAGVPQAALHASRQREKESRQENEQLRNQLAQMQGQIELLSRSVNQPRPQVQQPQEQPQKVDFWADPDQWGQTLLSPIQQQLQQQHERTSRILAVQQHGQETVEGAYRAMGQAIQANPSMRGELQRIMQADHPFDELVRWHKQTEAMKTVGNDPEAWFTSRLEAMLSDPQQSAGLVERLRGTAATNTNRSAPVTQVPPSLNRMPGGTASSDMSDEALFSQAMSR